MQTAQDILGQVTGTDSQLEQSLFYPFQNVPLANDYSGPGYSSVGNANIPAGQFGYYGDITPETVQGSSGTPKVLGTQQGPVGNTVADYLGINWPWNSTYNPANNILGQSVPGSSSTGNNPNQSSVDSFLAIVSNIPRMLSIIIGLIMIIAGLYMLGNRSVNTAVSILASEKGAKLL